MSARNMAKRTAAGTLALAVCLGGGAIALASAASADANFKFDQRIQGDDRYGTAIAASKAAFDKADNVILVNGYATVDGLTASYLAGVANAPILYVSDKGADDATKAEIKRLGAKNIWLVGGTTVIPTSVETAIKGDGYNVQRINGSDRYETAAMIAEAGIKLNGGKKPSKVFVASGTSFADALAVSPVAFVKGYPVILTDKDSTSDFSKKELGNIGTDNKILVGGEAVVSKKVQADLSIKDEMRVAGADRAVTANLVSDWAKKSEGFNPANAALVGGTNGNGADSLVAAPLLGKSFTTLHFAGWDATATYMKDHAAELTGKGFVFGGKAAVSDGQVSAAQSAAQTVNAGAFKVAGGQAAQTVSTVTGSVSDNKGVAQYTISGLNSSDTYDIVLADPTNVKVNADGSAAFKFATGSSIATLGTGAGSITVVNGVGKSSATVTSIKAVNGQITFTVDSNSVGGVVPVVFTQKDGNDTLAVDKNGVPTEAYGVGTVTTYLPVEADKGAVAADGLVSVVNKDAGYFATAAKTYKFSDKDTFYIGTTAATENRVSKADFLKALSKNDTLKGNGSTLSSYNPDFGSTFVLANTSPTAPGSIALTAVSDTSVKVAFTQPSSGQPDSYNIYRIATSTLPTKLSQFTKVGSVAGNATDLSFTDKGLSASTQYYYTVTAVADTDESVMVNPSSTTTLAAGATAALDATWAGVVKDDTFQNEWSNGDVWRFVFNNPVDASSGTVTGAVRVKDADGEIKTITLGSTATNTATVNQAPVTIGATTYAAGKVLTVAFASSTAADYNPDNTVTGADGKLNYPLTVTNASSVKYTDANSVVTYWNPATATDSKLESATSSPAIVSVAPTLKSAVGDSTTQKIVVTADQPIANISTFLAATGQWGYKATSGGSVVNPTSVAVITGGKVELTFTGGTIASGDTLKQITYTKDSSTANKRAVNLDGTEAGSPVTITLSSIS